MKLHAVTAHNDCWRFRIYETVIQLAFSSGVVGERPYRCFVRMLSTDKSIIDGISSLTDSDRVMFAAGFLMKHHPGEQPMLSIVEGSVILELQCPWKRGCLDFFLVTVAVVDRYSNGIPDHVDIQISAIDFSPK